MTSLDHIAVSAATLEAGLAHVEAALGHCLGAGGRHAAMGTHNRLSGLGAEYLEVIAIDPDAPPPGRARWFNLDRRTGPARLSNWVVRVADLDAALASRPEAGRAVSVARGAYRWRMAVPDDGALPFDGCFPALIEWESAPPQFAETGLRLDRLTLRHPAAARLSAALDGLLDDPRIVVETGTAGLEARIHTPAGPRRLT
jgi:hypothetical protein